MKPVFMFTLTTSQFSHQHNNNQPNEIQFKIIGAY